MDVLPGCCQRSSLEHLEETAAGAVGNQQLWARLRVLHVLDWLGAVDKPLLHTAGSFGFLSCASPAPSNEGLVVIGVQLGCEKAAGALMSPGCPQQSRVLGRVLEHCSSSGHSRGKAAFLSANQGLQTRREEGWLCPGSGCFGNNAYL